MQRVVKRVVLLVVVVPSLHDQRRLRKRYASAIAPVYLVQMITVLQLEPLLPHELLSKKLKRVRISGKVI